MLSSLRNAVSSFDKRQLESELISSVSDSMNNKSDMQDTEVSLTPEEKVESGENSPSQGRNQHVGFSDIRVKSSTAPVLKGSYRIEGDYAVWHGEWGMSEAAFTNQGITSKFAYQSQLPIIERKNNEGKNEVENTSESVRSQIESKHEDGDESKSIIHRDSTHPSCEGLKLSKLENYPCFEPDETSPVFLGYGYSREVASPVSLPHIGHYSGFFNIQVVNAPPQKVLEKDVHLDFICNPAFPSLYTVVGKGVNKFGSFDLKGSYDSNSGELKVYKIYEPKKPPLRVMKKRKSSIRAAKNITPTTATPKPARSTPASASVVTPKQPTIAKLTAPVNHTDETFGGSTVNTPTGEPSRWSKRKSIMPFHLREDSMPSRRIKLSDQLKKCQALLKQISNTQWSQPFLLPVDPVALNIPDYFTIVRNPMDLGTIKKKLDIGEYQSSQDFAEHVRLVFRNATTYNRPEHMIHQWAKILLNMFDTKYEEIDATIVKAEVVGGKNKKSKGSKEKSSVVATTKSRGGKGAKGNTKPSSRRKLEKEAEIEMMKKQIEMMKSQIEMLHSGAAVPVANIGTPRASNQATVIPVPAPDGDEDNRPMTFEEKRELSLNINRLPDQKLNRVVQIISERIPLSRNQDPNEEIEIDINSFDTPTLRLLQRYVRQCLSSKRKRPSGKPKRPESQLALAKQVEETTQQRIQSVERQLAALDKGLEAATSGDLMNGVHSSLMNASVTGDDISRSLLQQMKKESSSSSGTGSDSSSDSDSDSSDSDSSQETSALYSSEKPSLVSVRENGSNISGSSLMENQVSLFSGVTAVAGTTITTGQASHGVSDVAIRDECSTKPIKLENVGAWSTFVSVEGSPKKDLSASLPESTLWSTVRSQEQFRQLQAEEIMALEQRLLRAKELEVAEIKAELAQKRIEHERELQRQRDIELQRLDEVEKGRAAARAAARAQRQKESQSVDLDEQSLIVSSMEREFGSTTSYATERSFD